MGKAEKRTALIETVEYMRKAKNEIVFAIMTLDRMDGFESTIKEMKETVGDLTVAVMSIDQSIANGDFD